MADKELKDRLNALLFPNEKCEKCGCHQTWHGWWIEDGDVRCHNCVSGIQMAQVVYSARPSCYRRCYRDIYTLEDAEKEQAVSHG